MHLKVRTQFVSLKCSEFVIINIHPKVVGLSSPPHIALSSTYKLSSLTLSRIFSSFFLSSTIPPIEPKCLVYKYNYYIYAVNVMETLFSPSLLTLDYSFQHFLIIHLYCPSYFFILLQVHTPKASNSLNSLFREVHLSSAHNTTLHINFYSTVSLTLSLSVHTIVTACFVIVISSLFLFRISHPHLYYFPDT